MAGDDSFSASELRQRYLPGGTVKDSELSSSQLRARYGVQTNSFKAGGNVLLVYGVVAIIIIAALILKLWSGK